MRSHCGAGLFLIKAAYDARRHHTRPSHRGKLRIRRCALPQYPAYCLDTCPALCRSICYPLRRSPLWTNFPPPLLRRPASSKRGPRESSDDLKAKYLLAPVMMEAAAPQRFTFSTTFSSSRLLSLLYAQTARGPATLGMILSAALAITNAVLFIVCRACSGCWDWLEPVPTGLLAVSVAALRSPFLVPKDTL